MNFGSAEAGSTRQRPGVQRAPGGADRQDPRRIDQTH